MTVNHNEKNSPRATNSKYSVSLSHKTFVMDKVTLFGRRLKMARQRKGFSMDELSRMTNDAVSKQTISKYEAGKAMAGTVILSRLAQALDVSMDYFFRPFSFDMSELPISFRKKASVGAKEVLALRSSIQELVEKVLEIEQILSRDSSPCWNVSAGEIASPEQMVKLAMSVRDSWGIGNSAIGNVKEMLIRQGVKVFDVAGPNGFDGVSGIINDSVWIVVLNKNCSMVERRRMTGLHEYAHLIANRSFPSQLTNKEKEDLCTLFASEMLLPSQVLLDYYKGNRKVSLQELKSFQCVYGISIDAIMHTLKRVGVISDKRYRSYCIKKNTDVKFKSYVELSRFQEKETSSVDERGAFETMVYSALAQGLISKVKAAELLECAVGDVENNAISF